MGDGDNGAARRALLRDLAAIHANLARLRIPPLLDAAIAEHLDDDDLSVVVEAERHNLARVAAAVEEMYGTVPEAKRTKRRGS